MRQHDPWGSLIGFLSAVTIYLPAGRACQATYAPIGQRRPASTWPGLSAVNASIRSASCSRGDCSIAESRPCPGKAGAPLIGECASAPKEMRPKLKRFSVDSGGSEDKGDRTDGLIPG